MEFTFNSAFWTFNMVSNWAYTRYRDMIPEIQSVQSELEGKYIANTYAVDAAALQLYNKDKALGIKFITDYSVNAGNATVKRWQELYAYLFTKYMDGNIKTKDGNNMVEYPLPTALSVVPPGMFSYKPEVSLNSFR